MNAFDRICAVVAFVLGLILLLLGALGLFTGCKANFTLPPVLGILPGFVGWGILRSIVVAWNVPSAASLSHASEVCQSVRTLRNDSES